MKGKGPSIAMSFGFVFVFISICIQDTEATEGRLFYLSFMNISTDYPGPKDGIQEIFIASSSVDGRVKIRYNHPMNYTEIVRLNSTNDWKYTRRIVPTDLATQLNARVNVAIVVSASMDVSVQANKAETGSGDGYLALPVTAQSRQYFLASYSGVYQMSQLFSIVSPFNDTCIAVSYVNGSSGYRITHLAMQENDVYHSGALDFDYTGVLVSSSRPIAVLSGHACAMVPAGKLYCDHLVEQVPPVSQWGRSFLVSSFWGRPWQTGFRIRVVGQKPTNVTIAYQLFDSTGNPVQLTELPVVSVDRGQWYEASFENLATSGPVVVMVNCSENCLVMQYATGFQVLGADGPGERYLPDPFMVTALPLDHFQNGVRFSTSRHYANGSDYECANGITIVAKKSELWQIFLDGYPIGNIGGVRYNVTAANWSDYAVIIAPLTVGFHSVTALDSDVLYAVYVYGYGIKDHTGYGYLGGYRYLYGANDQRLTETFPLFDFSQASTSPPPLTPSPTRATPSPAGPPVISESDAPVYTMRYVGRYYAFNLDGKLITKFCSEGYARYFREKRLGAMKAKVERHISKYCSSQPGASVGVTFDGFIYSEYTAGVIELTVRVKGVGSATFNHLVSCVRANGSGLLGYFEDLSNWVDRYNNSRDVLKTDAEYTDRCDVVHFLPEKFVGAGHGWLCPGGAAQGVASASSASGFDVCAGLATVLAHWLVGKLTRNPSL